jgi:hypothetical protein
MSKIVGLGQGRRGVAGTITWQQLRELAAFRAESGCAVSIYVNLDPSEVPTSAGLDTRAGSLISVAHRMLEERKGSLGRDQREALKRDIERIAAWFDDGLDRQGLRGVAVFAAALDNLWSTVPLPDPVADEVKIGADLYLAPLARLAGRGDGMLVAAVGRERGQVFMLQGGQLVEFADATEDESHWRRVADTLDHFVRTLPGARIALVGVEGMRADFESILSPEVKGRLLGWTTAEAHADAAHLLDAVRPVLEGWWAKREEELIERWRAEAAKNGRAATGWAQTLEAASDGRAELLLVQDGADAPAYQCPRCGRAQVSNGSCPLDGTTLDGRDSGLDLAVHQTLAHGGTVQVIRGRRDLDPVGGVGALLRY